MTDEEILATFEPKGSFLFRYGPLYDPDVRPLQLKLCLTSTAVGPMARALYDLSRREDCFVVKMDPAPLRNGMVRGRCFLGSAEAIGEAWVAHKVTDTLLCTIQDDDFTEKYRPE